MKILKSQPLPAVYQIEYMKTIKVAELKQMMDNKEDFQLVDVREQNEFDYVNMNAQLIPLSELPQHIEKFSRGKKVIVHCKSGARSANVIAFLQEHHGYDNLYNLTGGILAWANEIDPSLPTY